jgi:hypothetical protein
VTLAQANNLDLEFPLISSQGGPRAA